MKLLKYAMLPSLSLASHVAMTMNLPLKMT